MFADLNATAAAEAAEECKAFSNTSDFRAISTQIDVTDSASVQRAVDLAVKEFGGIHYCVNSAGVS
jgi:NAD(P)-dependent dehydrogenase (short-subunit alcohol dehydrogenase family)